MSSHAVANRVVGFFNVKFCPLLGALVTRQVSQFSTCLVSRLGVNRVVDALPRAQLGTL